MKLEEKVKLLDMLKEGKSYAECHFSLNESTVRYIRKKETEIHMAVLTAKECNDVQAQEGDDAGELEFFSFDEPASEEEKEEEEPQAGPSSVPQGFQRLFCLKSVSVHGEAASADTETAAKYLEPFKKLIEQRGYHPQQVFNMDKTGLFWKKMPFWIYLMKDKAKASRFKAQNDTVTFLTCGNADGLMLKPGLIYKPANPRALNNKNTHLLCVLDTQTYGLDHQSPYI
ncbi:jerky protein homolog-like [Macrobrachium nipponense]|uniref:jerky protein homolog-like n=1 Tax=Macrobrachium nipponense TaxID=159736 RepID=UPI0030C821E3